MEAVTDYVESLAPYVEKAGHAVGPLAQSARTRSAAAAATAVEALGPKLNDAFERVSPAVEVAQKKVQDDLLPRLTEVLERAAESDVAVAATKRGAATVAALKGELELPEPKKKKGRGRLLRRLALLAALAGVGYVAFKKFFGPKDSGWETYQPSAPYAGSTTTTATAAPSPEAAATAADATAATAAAATEPATGETEAESVDRIDPPGGDQGSKYGPGSYVGDEPPAGYTVKGNERSMKYHTADSGGYERTIADVWFDSEASAEAAGFSKAQR
ncbi:hypothetical protein GC722_15175 [Auraticoccus sp. F435]|uniref:50S ribosomal protein L4 n=1 Tax=Auraticoccus cholistanensis TaxID=2656650 RepID=A0A6A9UZE2_9ACTN|nr:hypothetical protein [Auraticoccus cholistanensis]